MMGDRTIIGWTNHTFNVAWGCVKVSPGCKNCYADSLSSRYGHHVWGANMPRRTFGDKHWAEPLKWNAAAEATGERARVFCSSMCDIGEDHATIIEEMRKLWPLIRRTPWLDWQLLTKRAERYGDVLPADWGAGYRNVWLGTSIENNDYVWRAEELKKFPSTVRFVSYEPALGPLDKLDLDGLDWIIYGGESGPGYRDSQASWAIEMWNRCEAAGVAFFDKQKSGYRTELGPAISGKLIREYPTPRLALPVIEAVLS